jgi:hypothetical protein
MLPLILVGLSLVVRPLPGNDQLQSRDLQPMPDPAGEDDDSEKRARESSRSRPIDLRK